MCPRSVSLLHLPHCPLAHADKSDLSAASTLTANWFVAVPAVLGYNWLLRRNKVIQDNVRNFAADLHAYLVSGARVGTG